jgi:hypothetical protein
MCYYSQSKDNCLIAFYYICDIYIKEDYLLILKEIKYIKVKV